MLTRRALLASTSAAAPAPACVRARADTPKGTVMAKQIDDIISFDPAESYEFTNTRWTATAIAS